MWNTQDNKERKIFRWLISTYLTQDLFDWLLENRTQTWEQMFQHETVESMKRRDLPWPNTCLVVAIQDFLDALKDRKDDGFHTKSTVGKDPYLFDMLALLQARHDPNGGRQELEGLILEKIETGRKPLDIGRAEKISKPFVFCPLSRRGLPQNIPKHEIRSSL